MSKNKDELSFQITKLLYIFQECIEASISVDSIHKAVKPISLIKEEGGSALAVNNEKLSESIESLAEFITNKNANK